MMDLCDRFEAEHLPRKRPGTAADYRRMLRIHIRPHFGNHVKVADVAFTDIDSLHRKITKAGPSTPCQHHGRGAEQDVRARRSNGRCASDNPCKGIESNGETIRKRYLIGDELARLTTALAEHPDQAGR